MATSKLLKPTNVTISIPEFTDQPDQRVNSNCIDKEADAINSLSEQIGTLRIKDITDATRTTASSTSSTTNIDQLYTVPADGWYRLVSHCPSNASSEAYCKAGSKQLIYAAANQRVEIVIPIKQGTKIYLSAIYGGSSFIEQYTM